jgi:hypothetical protein
MKTKVTTVRAVAVCAVLLVLAMIGVYAATGVGQDGLQFSRAPAAYAAVLLRNPDALRLTVGLDDLFVVLYGTLFLLMGQRLLERGAARALVFPAVALLLGVAFLDGLENFHFLTMLADAERGAPPGAGEIAAQVGESMLKFHASYFGLFLLGLAQARRTTAERVLRFLLVFVQLPVGIAIHVSPAWLATPLVFVRFTFFVVALLLSGLVFGAPPEGDSGARA